MALQRSILDDHSQTILDNAYKQASKEVRKHHGTLRESYDRTRTFHANLFVEGCGRGSVGEAEKMAGEQESVGGRTIRRAINEAVDKGGWEDLPGPLPAELYSEFLQDSLLRAEAALRQCQNEGDKLNAILHRINDTSKEERLKEERQKIFNDVNRLKKFIKNLKQDPS